MPPGNQFLMSLDKRAVVGVFDGGEIATDGGGLALRELEEGVGILKRLGGCFPTTAIHGASGTAWRRW